MFLCFRKKGEAQDLSEWVGGAGAGGGGGGAVSEFFRVINANFAESLQPLMDDSFNS